MVVFYVNALSYLIKRNDLIYSMSDNKYIQNRLCLLVLYSSCLIFKAVKGFCRYKSTSYCGDLQPYFCFNFTDPELDVRNEPDPPTPSRLVFYWTILRRTAPLRAPGI